VQEFDPPGVAARNCRSACSSRLATSAPTTRWSWLITKHLQNLEKKNYAAIAKDLNQPVDEIYEAAKVVMGFEPKPGRCYTAEEPTYITPDVYIHKVGDKYFVVGQRRRPAQAEDLRVLPDRALGRQQGQGVHPGAPAQRPVADPLDPAAPAHHRAGDRVDPALPARLLRQGAAYLKPLILRDVAEDIGMHESTVSRVTTNKYVHTPQGIFELKYFFNSGIARTNGDDLASEAVKLKIKQIISGEDPRHPHSDQKIVELLAIRTSRSLAAPLPSTGNSLEFSPAASAGRCSEVRALARCPKSRIFRTRGLHVDAAFHHLPAHGGVPGGP
jgi:RNA polymerase sigma-54 factor